MNLLPNDVGLDSNDYDDRIGLWGQLTTERPSVMDARLLSDRLPHMTVITTSKGDALAANATWGTEDGQVDGARLKAPVHPRTCFGSDWGRCCV